jgi:hypothetical protein
VRALIADYGYFLRRHFLWWLLPPVLLLGALAALVFVFSEPDVSSFVYGV